MTRYQVKCPECNKNMLRIPTTVYGYAVFYAESHNMEIGHTSDIIEV